MKIDKDLNMNSSTSSTINTINKKLPIDNIYEIWEDDEISELDVDDKTLISSYSDSGKELFLTANKSLPSKTATSLIVKMSKEDLEDRRNRLNNYLQACLAIALSELVGDFQRGRVCYELNWFFETGAHCS
jgi:hypothetical protein